MPILRDVLAQMNQWADLSWAEDWDNPGLQIGETEQDIHKVLLALTPSVDAVDYACKNGYDLLLTHHPLIFGKLKNITDKDSPGKSILKLIKNNVAVASYHTNLDMAPQGVNDTLAEKLGLKNIQGFIETGKERYYKLVVYVPAGYEDAVRMAICNAGGGHIGTYSDCTFRAQGIGTFFAREGADPFIGPIGAMTETEEYRLETVIAQSKLSQGIEAMKQAHPYEEVAFDVLKLENIEEKRYIGRIGDLEKELSLEEFLHLAGHIIGQNHFTYQGNLTQKIKKVALCGGSGATYMVEAKKAGADIYLTGDVKFHDYQKAGEIGLAVVDGGHFYTEKLVLDEMKKYLKQTLNLDADIYDEIDFVKHYQC